ncbi:MAG: hypothetical protein JST75_00230 [Bacteroidetes bacterium]|nr:hypothetical protein [Bacteroidota bacterium]
MDQERQIANYLHDQWSIELKDQPTIEEIKEKLSQHISYLINHDFAGLINMLYKIDVSEKKLKSLLKENTDADAGNIIAGLIIERQLQKIKTRQDMKRDDNRSNEDKW